MDLNELLERVERLEARGEIEDLLGEYLHLRMAGDGQGILDRIWSGREDIRIEYGASGPYQSRAKVATFYQKDHLPGKFTLMQANTPVIRVARDGRSARGLWMVLGAETDAGDLGPEPPADPNRRALLSSQTPEGKAYTAEWMFLRLGADFVKEAGQWRLWHLHVYEILRAPFDQDWVQYATKRFETDGMRLDALFRSNLPFAEDGPPENLATGASTCHWQYTVDGLSQAVPQVPEPYSSTDDMEQF